MGKASKAARNAERKSKRADRKRTKADRAQNNGRPKRAARLRARADKLDARAADLNNAVQNGLIRGLFGKVISVNELGNVTVEATWTYNAEDLASYESLELSIAPAWFFRSTGQAIVGLGKETKKHSFGPMKNQQYRLKLFGIGEDGKTFLDRTTVKRA